MTLRTFFIGHIDKPFPTDGEKRSLAAQCSLNFKQVSDWFTNTRKRFWRPHRDHLESVGCILVKEPSDTQQHGRDGVSLERGGEQSKQVSQIKATQWTGSFTDLGLLLSMCAALARILRWAVCACKAGGAAGEKAVKGGTKKKAKAKKRGADDDEDEEMEHEADETAAAAAPPSHLHSWMQMWN